LLPHHITELVKAKHGFKAIADYIGTSVAMIEKDHCNTSGLSTMNTAKD
jgi:hypothetical protein